jgi:hypothetical protein
MATDRQDLLDSFIERIRDEYPATVCFHPDSAELAAVLEALRKAAGDPASPTPPSARGADRGASASREDEPRRPVL